MSTCPSLPSGNAKPIFWARFLLIFSLAVSLAHAADNPVVNHTLPSFTAPSFGLALSENPSETELKSTRIFAEPLVPLGHSPSASENRLLAKALRTHLARTDTDDFSALEQFLHDQPDSAWTAALAFNLATEYYNTGWYSKALRSWERAWTLLKSSNDPAGKALADRAAGELAFMYGRLGRMAELSALLESLDGRTLIGSATEKISGAREGLWTMRNRPEMAFRCGPYALDRILNFESPAKAGNPLIRAAQSTTNGCSLSQVAALSAQVGMNFQMAFRSNGAPVLLPAVVNWKLGHYAAMLKEENGKYLLQDPTFGNDTWLSPRALEEESSGYFLVGPGKLPVGWRAVDATEGAHIFGKGSTTQKDDSSTTPKDKEKCPPKNPQGDFDLNNSTYAAMAVPNVELMLVSLDIHDTPVGYSPPVGPPVWFTLSYNQREANQPAIFSYSNFGPKWTFNWLAFITDNPSSLSADVSYYTDGGGALSFTGFNSANQTFAPETKSQAVLRRTSATSYEMVFLSGAKIIFGQPGSFGGTTRRVFMTQMVDPAGNATRITYDSNFRVVAITDAIGQVTTFSYENTNDILKVTKVTDPFGRFAAFSYDSSNRLAQITDTIGLTSQFGYDTGDFIQTLTTPYGTTSFEKGENGPQRWLVTTYPNGEKDRVEFYESSSIGVPDSDPAAVVPAGMPVANIYHVYRNTFFWDRKSYAEAAGDYTKAHLYHWLHYSAGVCSGILESEKAPLENRVWYAYDGQSIAYNIGTSDKPKAIGRVLADGTTQLNLFSYNGVGHVTNTVDASGRSLTYVYATNLIDLLEVRLTTGTNNDLLGHYVCNSQHLPVAVYDAAGQMTTNVYNARGQLISSTNPNGETRTLNRDANGYILSVDGPLPGPADTTVYTHDTVGRVRTATTSDGYNVTFSYDKLNRPTNILYPDGTFTAFTYNKLDRVKARDRQGRETIYAYDALDRLVAIQNPLNEIERFEYCNCGSVAALIDPQGRPTRWDYDIEGRIVSKQYPDGSRLQFNYDPAAGRLASVRDEKGQITTYSYDVEGNLLQISYPIAQHATPSVTYTYDPNYNRVASIQDAIGTTTYSYNPVGAVGALQPSEIDGPWANQSVQYQYDELGRIKSRNLNGATESFAYDILGRVTNAVNSLGRFTYDYVGATGRILDVLNSNGQATHYDYLSVAGDTRLRQITHQAPNASVISRFGYLYDSQGSITNWSQELGAVTNDWNIGYDTGKQLTSVQAFQNGSATNYAYAYDTSGNRTSETVAGSSRSFQYNSLNQLVSVGNAPVTNSTYEWDVENRLVAVNQGASRSEFSYDGLGRRSRITEKSNGVVTAESRYVWSGQQLCEERDANNVVTKRFFSQGCTLGNTPYYYTRDHLGSVRELVDVNGQVQARYSYDPYGRRTALVENQKSPFGFTGHFLHASSGLYLTPNRPLNIELGRWLSRDPLGETVSYNLYNYAANDPINLYDPLGACTEGNESFGHKLNEFLDNLDEAFEDVDQTFKVAKEATELYLNAMEIKAFIQDEGLMQFLEKVDADEKISGQFEKVEGALGIIGFGLDAANVIRNGSIADYLNLGIDTAGYVKNPLVQAFVAGANAGGQIVYDAAWLATKYYGEDKVDDFLIRVGNSAAWQPIDRFLSWRPGRGP